MNKITIIIPAYNAQDYVSRCIESINRQKNKNFKVIIVDDGSTDSTLELINAGFKKIKNVSILSKENGGVSSARNYALSKVETEYFCFMDIDDVIEDDYIDIFLKEIDKNRFDFIISGFKKTDNHGKIRYVRTVKNKMNISKENFNTVALDLFEQEIFFTPISKLYRRDIVNKYALRFSDDRFGEDFFFNVEYISRCENIKIISESAYLYYYNVGSAMTKYVPNKFEEMMKVEDVLKKIFIQYGIIDKGILNKRMINLAFDTLLNYYKGGFSTNQIKKEIYYKQSLEILNTFQSNDFNSRIKAFMTRHPRISRKLLSFRGMI